MSENSSVVKADAPGESEAGDELAKLEPMALPPITVGDFVEIQRFDKIVSGVVLELPANSTSRFSQCSTILAKGQIFRHHLMDVCFYIPGWAFSEAVRNDVFPSVSPVSDTAYELLQHWNSSPYAERSLNIPTHVHHNLERIKSAAEANLHKNRSRLEEKTRTFQSQGLASVRVDDLAKLVFGNGHSPAELYATFLWMMKQPRYFDISDPRALVSYRKMRLRSDSERNYLDWLHQQVKSLDAKDAAGGKEKPEIKSFLASAARVLAQQRPRSAGAPAVAEDSQHAALVNKNNDTALPCFVSTEPENFTSFETGTCVSVHWSKSDIKFLRCMLECACSSPHFPNPYRNLTNRIVRSLPSPPKGVGNSKNGDILLLLKELALFAPWEDMSALLSSSGEFHREFLSRREGLTRFLDRDFSDSPPSLLIDRVYANCLKVAQNVVDHAEKPGLHKGKRDKGSSRDPMPETAEFNKKLFINNYAGKPLQEDFYKHDPLAALRESVSEQVFTIDDPNAREIDDGVSVTPAVPNPQSPEDWWLHVHIADPTSMIPPDSLLAAVSQFRASSVYFPSRHWAMMPEILSEKIFNLGTSPYALTFSARLGANGDIADYKIRATHLESVKLCYYDNVDSILRWDGMYGYSDRSSNSPWVNSFYESQAKQKVKATELSEENRLTLRQIQVVTDKHTGFRVDNGAIAFDKPEYTVSVGPYPLPLSPGGKFGTSAARTYSEDLFPSIRLEGNKAPQLSPSKVMVAEAMIIAGRVAARFCYDHKLPVVYRAQESVFEHCTKNCSPQDPFDHRRVDAWGTKPRAEELIAILDRARAARCKLTGTIPFMEHHANLFALLPSGRPTLLPEKQASLGIPGLENLAAGQERASGYGFVTSPGVLSTDAGGLKARVVARSKLDNVMVGYNKVTSPLRRFGDLLSHWQIKSQLLKLNNKKGERPFSESMVESLLLPLHASEKFSKVIGVKSSRFWALEWVMRREQLLKSGNIDSNEMTMPPLGKNLWTYLNANSVGNRKAAKGAVYTAYVTAHDGLTGASFVILLELGGLQAKVAGVSKSAISQQKRAASVREHVPWHKPGDQFPVVVSRVVPSFGALEVSPL